MIVSLRFYGIVNIVDNCNEKYLFFDFYLLIFGLQYLEPENWNWATFLGVLIVELCTED